MTIKTLIHEAVHSRLHTDSQRYQKDKAKMEFEAESIAYIVSKHLGIHTDDYSFAYLSSWTKQGKLIEEFTESLQRISSEAQQMIQQLDQYFEKHKGLSKEQPQNKFEERLARVNNKPVNHGQQAVSVNKISTEGGNSVKK